MLSVTVQEECTRSGTGVEGVHRAVPGPGSTPWVHLCPQHVRGGYSVTAVSAAVARKDSLGSTSLLGPGSLPKTDNSAQGGHYSSRESVREEKSGKDGIG